MSDSAPQTNPALDPETRALLELMSQELKAIKAKAGSVLEDLSSIRHELATCNADGRAARNMIDRADDLELTDPEKAARLRARGDEILLSLFADDQAVLA